MDKQVITIREIPPPYACPYDGRIFDSKLEFMLHIFDEHKPKICPVCGQEVPWNWKPPNKEAEKKK